MKCFSHHTEAIGICKHCMRALCPDCCTDLNDGLACKGMHEAEVKHINGLIQISEEASSESFKASLLGTSFNIFMGLVFLGFGFYMETDPFLVILGIGFVIYGLIAIVNDTRYFKRKNTNLDK